MATVVRRCSYEFNHLLVDHWIEELCKLAEKPEKLPKVLPQYLRDCYYGFPDAEICSCQKWYQLCFLSQNSSFQEAEWNRKGTRTPALQRLRNIMADRYRVEEDESWVVIPGIETDSFNGTMNQQTADESSSDSVNETAVAIQHTETDLSVFTSVMSFVVNSGYHLIASYLEDFWRR